MLQRLTSVYSTETKAILLFVYGCAGASAMVIFIRFLSAEFSSTQIVFFRNAFALVFFIPWLLKEGDHIFDLSHIKTSQLKIYISRGILGLIAMNCYFYSLTIVPLNVATSLSFISPIITALFAVIFLKEKYGIHRWSAMFIGFLGTLVVLRPGTEAFDPTSLFVIFAACLWSTSGILIKNASKKDSPHKIAFYMVLFMTPLSLPTALIDWKPISFEWWPYIIGLGLVSMLFQVALSRAISMTEMAVILPYDFTRLIFVATFSYFCFGETLDLWTIIGATIILGSAVYSSYRDKLHRQKQDAKPTSTTADSPAD